jgi:hypothetical protein
MTYGEPSLHADGDPTLGPLFVTVATKFYARTGEWPWWFRRVVGEHVPRAYVALALHHRRELEHELGVRLPVVRRPPVIPRQRMTQLGLDGVEAPTRTTADPRRGAA